MASEQDRSPSDSAAFIDALPSHPNLEMQQKRAKNLLRAAPADDADAWRRIRALHPQPPTAEAFKLADAQLVIARGYGFESWAAMRRKIDSLTKTPLEQFHAALRAGDAVQLRALLEAHADVRDAVNQPVPNTSAARPVGWSGRTSTPSTCCSNTARTSISRVIGGPAPSARSKSDITPEEAAPLIARGAIVDIVAAGISGCPSACAS